MSELKRTYVEAVEIMVKWWTEKSFHTALNQNNGDPSLAGGYAYSLGNMLADKAKEAITPEKIKVFETVLTNLLMGNKYEGRWGRQCSVDYDPNTILSDACKAAGIDTACLPIKTFTFINAWNEVEGRYQYGGEWFKI